MTAATVRSRTGRDRSRMYRPGLVTLTRLEMRKMIDTRSGFWLLLVIGLIAVAGATIGVFAGPDSDRKLEGFFQIPLLPTALLLPVLGILMVTTEWSQRTVMSTFSLVPNRARVAAAKLLAGVAYAVLAVVWCLAVAVVGYGVAVVLGKTVEADWSLRWAVVGGSLLYLAGVLVIGIAFGMVFQNSPVAIVLYFVLPTAMAVLAQSIQATKDVLSWLDYSSHAGTLVDASTTSDDWKHLGTAALFWIVLPAVLGVWRLLTREVK